MGTMTMLKQLQLVVLVQENAAGVKLNHVDVLLSGGTLNYTFDGKIVEKESPIFECRALCQCKNCDNRVVQNGPISDLVVHDFGSKGLGLICQKAITKGTFVCEYAGELISVQRAKKRSKTDKMNYILYVVEN